MRTSRETRCLGAALVLAACGGETTNIYQETGGGGGAAASDSAATNAVTAASSTVQVSAASSGQGGGSTSATGAGGAINPPECVVPQDCPGVDNDCRTRTCTDGACGVVFTKRGTPVGEQVPDDCAVTACDGAGNVATLYDPTDVVDDGDDCTVETCTTVGQSPHHPKADGEQCTSNCGCAPCAPAQQATCAWGLCQAGTCVPYIPVKCKIGGTTYTSCTGTASSAFIAWDTDDCPGYAKDPHYCAPGKECTVIVGGDIKGTGICE